MREFVFYIRETYLQNGLCIAFVDFAGFKKVNDELGHEFGDLILFEFGEKIKSNNFLAFRRGSDEFIIIGACTEIRKMEKSFEKSGALPFESIGCHIETTPIFGICQIPESVIIPPSNIKELEHFRNIMGNYATIAETACYEKKRKSGRERER